MAVSTEIAASMPDASPARQSEKLLLLRAGDTRYGLPVADVEALADRVMPAFVTGQGITGLHAALRSGLKALLPMAVRVFMPDVAKFAEQLHTDLPLFDLRARRQDSLHDFTRYLVSLLLAVMASQEWKADVAQTDAGYLRITGLSSADRTVETDSARDRPSE